MKKSASLFFVLTLPLLLGGCYYPYYDDGTALAQPATPVYSGYYSYYYNSPWPGYSYYGPSYYYNRTRWSRPAYAYPPPRRWHDWRPSYRPGYHPPLYRPNPSGPRPGFRTPPNPVWKKNPVRPNSRPAYRPNSRPSGFDFRAPRSFRPPAPSRPAPRVHRW